MTIVSQPSTPTPSRRPTVTLPTPPLTVADLDEIGLDDPRLELVDGMWIVRPWPTPLRTRVTQRLSRLLAAAAPDGAAAVAH
ncbi:MAG: Uma2 family endonuclease, partial [Frankia sp.]